MRGNSQAGGRATIIDIARQAGVSKSTVSLVLKNSSLVREETRFKVEHAMASLGYVYNRAAANLRLSRSNFVGMVMSDLNNAFFSELATGIEDAFYRAGYVPILANTNEDPERETRVLQVMREQGVAGVIISPTGQGEALAEFRRSQIPLVTVARHVEMSGLPYVGQDNITGAQRACSYLISLGHRRIVFLAGPSVSGTSQERQRGYRQALEQAGITFDPALVFDSAPTRHGGAQAAEAMLSSGCNATAALCFNDIVAFGAMTHLSRRGYEIGKDFSVIGFDNISESEFYRPPLTTVDAHTRALGEQGAKMLLGLISNPGEAAEVTREPVELILRKSCGPAPKRGE